MAASDTSAASVMGARVMDPPWDLHFRAVACTAVRPSYGTRCGTAVNDRATASVSPVNRAGELEDYRLRKPYRGGRPVYGPYPLVSTAVHGRAVGATLSRPLLQTRDVRAYRFEVVGGDFALHRGH